MLSIRRIGFSIIALLFLAPLLSASVLGPGTPQGILHIVPLSLAILFLAFGLLLKDSQLETDEPILNERLIAGSIVMLALALRLTSVNFGLPDEFYHPDEVVKVRVIAGMMKNGDLNPHYFLHPTLLIYLTYAASTVVHLLGLFSAWSWEAATVLAGRLVSVTAGSGSVYLVYLIGKRIFPSPVPLLASLLLAVSPLHVTLSRYVKEDTLMTSVMLLCLFVTLKAVTESRPKLLMLAGLLAGVAASSKYPGAMSCLFIALAPWAHSRSLKPTPSFFIYGIAGALFAAIGFAACTPYSFIEWKSFVIDVKQEKLHMRRGHGVKVIAADHFYLYGFAQTITAGLTPIVTALSLVGLGAWLRRVRLNTLLLLLAGFAAFYFAAEMARAKNDRYLLPCLPFLALAAAHGGYLIYSRFNIRRYGTALALVLVLIPLGRSIWLSLAAGHDTRGKMEAWINANLPAKSSFIIPFRAYAPTLDETKYVVRPLYTRERLQKLTGGSLDKSGFDYLIMSSTFYDRYLSSENPSVSPRVVIRKVFERYPIVHAEQDDWNEYNYHNPAVLLLAVRPEDKTKFYEQTIEYRKIAGPEANPNDATARWRPVRGLRSVLKLY